MNNNLVKQKFVTGDKFININTNKKGTVRRLRDDDYEKLQRKNDLTHYYYHVDYDDGSFETYEGEKNMIPLT